MLMIARLYPKTDISRVWNYVENKMKEDMSETATPLYATQSEGMMNVGIIFDVDEPDGITKFITEDIVKCDEIHHTKTISLMKPIFFPIPKKKPENIQRYLIRIYTHPQHYKKIYDQLVDHRYSFNLFPIYVSYSLGDEDILMNVAADSKETVSKFLREHVRTLDGVNQSTFYPVHKSKRFASLEELIKTEGKYTFKKIRGMSEDEVDLEFDWVENFKEYAMLTGALPGDI